MTEQATTKPKRRYARKPNKSAAAATNPSAEKNPVKPRATKIGKVIALLQREAGATLDEMVKATGWLPHTTRAALTGLKKKGHAIARGKRDDVTCYRITKSA
ncbi:DUF3489 domain-containing protein [Altererythrobacter salegens]|uniref:DUF3489 domain-containing protein n=1 Tax=Croceibacterium salegens TaxID=1737568 RepID=A0A6I4T1H7_9SPHN|nr:DUF3489 domain-containing protein [Croceibacterium salegens]MXO61328.1 DUF3489 domain-containing protein [Croceibacterium salegens]